MENFSLSYREVIPDLSTEEEWHEIILNTGGTQSTLQDIKVVEKSGGYCYRNVQSTQSRNRFIYWRTYQDVLELSEISLDFNLYQNNLRYKFSDSPVLAVAIIEQDQYVTLLVTTVCSLHRINFPHPNYYGDDGKTGGNNATNASGAIDFNNSLSFSIFRDAKENTLHDPRSCYVIENCSGASNNTVPHAAVNFLSPSGDRAYFALACQMHLMLYAMNCTDGSMSIQQLKDHNIMPRLFSNLKGALTGRSDVQDADYATSMSFCYVNGQIYLLALYRNNHLRVWSTQTGQGVCSLNCVREGNERVQGPQNNSMRKIHENSVCIFLSHSNGAEFVCIDLLADNQLSTGISLRRRKVISAPQLDLADFSVSNSRIWALWSNAEGEFSISNYSLVRGTGMNWISAALEPPPDRYCVGIEQGMDPREAYCSYIFHPGKFDKKVIAKAIFMFRRSNIGFDAKHCSITMLKEHVCQAVDDEIQNEVKDFDVSDDEYLDIAMRLWERFYSCCEQYHMKSCQPTGLFILEPLDAVCVVKKSSFSILRPCEAVEHLMLAGEDVDVNIVVPTNFPDNEEVGEDFVNLMLIVSQLEKWLPEDIKMDFDKKLYRLEMPNMLISKLSDEILAGDAEKNILPRNFLVLIQQKLQTIKDLNSAMSLLLKSLRMDNGNPEAMQTHSDIAQSTRVLVSMGVLFGSHIGISILSETVRQTALMRFSICRNLLILQQVLIDTYSLPMDILETLRSQFMPDTVIFLQSYYVMVWMSETPLNLSYAASLESSMQRLQLLQLINGNHGRIYSNNGKVQLAPLLRVFLNSKGLYTALALFAESFKALETLNWTNTLMPLTTIVCQLIWPVSFNFVFGEWLFGTCQHIIIQDYVRLLNNWCEWNMCSRQFILGVSYLECLETGKAYDMFLQSAKGVLKEQFLIDKIVKDTPFNMNKDMEDDYNEDVKSISISNRAISFYYLKIIQLFEQHSALDHIISMAQVAIGLLEKDDPQLPMFQSIVFNNHLQLEHYEEAYHSLIYNADPSRRKDCLRQLVVTLFNKKRLDLLMHFPYVGLHEEFENIVESRARSLIMEQNEIYDFLYAFHVNNGNMRKASAIMYEQAMRLKLECDSLESMRRRCSTLLVCINALHLIDARYRWIAKPIVGEEMLNKSYDHDSNGTKPLVEVLEIKHIRQEYLLCEALVLLAEHRKDIHSFLNAGPEELAPILASCGLFTAAIKLAKGFEAPLQSIFDSLTAMCVHTGEECTNEAWSWLQENDLADIPHRNKPDDMAWALLQKLVTNNEGVNSTTIRKCVANKLLSLNAFIPQWLYNDYKKSNSAELLHLYIKHARLLEATELAKEMICAMLGAGSEYFSCKHSVSVLNPEMCFPLHSIDLLMHGLRMNSEDKEYKEAHTELQDIVEKYVQTAMRTANDKLELAYQRS